MAADDRCRAPRMDHAASETGWCASRANAVRRRTAYRDDRGDPLPCGPLRSIEAARRAGYDKKAIRRGLRSWRRASLREDWWVWVVPLACVIPAQILLTGVFSWFWLWPAAPIAAMALVASLPMVRRRVAGLHRRDWISLGLCPACGYAIAELEPQEDTCRVCPECGSAWKLDDPVSPPPS